MTTDPRPPRHVPAFRMLALVLVLLVVAGATWWTVRYWDLVLWHVDGVRPWLARAVGGAP